MSRKRLGIVLFVKNEARDLPAWFAWHAALECDTFLVYEDHSVDETWAVVDAAARVFNVRAHRTDLSISHFTDRQKASYLHALSHYGQEFEWLAFIDSDEFLATSNNEPFPQFLNQFPDAHAVALHWCNYGSNGHALHPTIPIVEAFTRHSANVSAINRHVKSVVRCAAHRGGFWNVHYFDVDHAHYVDSAGRPIEWSSTLGITAKPPDWQAARIRHYQCRSMEHFIDRLKLRPDVPATTQTWQHYDSNEIEDLSFYPLLGRFQAYHTALGRHLDRAAFTRLREKLLSEQEGNAAAGSTTRAAQRIFLVRTAHDTFLCCSKDNYRVAHQTLDALDRELVDPVFMIVPDSDPGNGILMLPYAGAWVKDDNRRNPLLAYRIDRIEAGITSLAIPHKLRFMSAIPAADASVGGGIDTDRPNVSTWEKMTLIPVERTALARVTPNKPVSLPDKIGVLSSFLRWVVQTDADDAVPVFNMLVMALTASDRTFIRTRYEVELRV